MNRAQASTVIKVVGAGIAAILTLAGYYLYLEHGTLSNDVPDDHLTAALGAFLIAQPWAAVALIVLVVGCVAFALGVLTGHVGEDAKRWAKKPSSSPEPAFHDFGPNVPIELHGCEPLQPSPKPAPRCAHCGSFVVTEMYRAAFQPEWPAKCASCGAPLEGNTR